MINVSKKSARELQDRRKRQSRVRTLVSCNAAINDNADQSDDTGVHCKAESGG